MTPALPTTRFDAVCREWEQHPSIGVSPTDAAFHEPGRWHLVYDLRPLELIPYWLGIPFTPHRPVYAIIYDDVNRAYYTGVAAKVQDLGRPKRVCFALPLSRLLNLSDGSYVVLSRMAGCVLAVSDVASRALWRFAERIDSLLRFSRAA